MVKINSVLTNGVFLFKLSRGDTTMTKPLYDEVTSFANGELHHISPMPVSARVHRKMVGRQKMVV